MLEPQNTLWEDEILASPTVSIAHFLAESTTEAFVKFKRSTVFPSTHAGADGGVNAAEYAESLRILKLLRYPL